jgi:hypothetical protein
MEHPLNGMYFVDKYKNTIVGIRYKHTYNINSYGQIGNLLLILQMRKPEFRDNKKYNKYQNFSTLPSSFLPGLWTALP